MNEYTKTREMNKYVKCLAIGERIVSFKCYCASGCLGRLGKNENSQVLTVGILHET